MDAKCSVWSLMTYVHDWTLVEDLNISLFIHWVIVLQIILSLSAIWYKTKLVATGINFCKQLMTATYTATPHEMQTFELPFIYCSGNSLNKRFSPFHLSPSSFSFFPFSLFIFFSTIFSFFYFPFIFSFISNTTKNWPPMEESSLFILFCLEIIRHLAPISWWVINE